MNEAEKRPCWGFYREAPFWSWNDVLEVDEAVRQIDLMKEGGWGGFFMHARSGLVTPYMEEKWMEVTRACVEHARKTGMCAYLYDENRWPSGFAGGAVPARGPEYRMKFLVISENLPEPGDGRYKWVASFAVEGRGRSMKAVAVPRETVGGDGRPVYHFYQYTCGLGNDWFFGTSYVDLLNPEVTDEFLRVTHDRYREAVGEDFGKTIPGMFTDEPCMAAMPWGPGVTVPWTPALPAVFEERRGYDLTEELLSLFLPVGDYRKVRYDFYRTITEMFVENYMKRVYDWCQRNGIAYTGHVNAEDTISYQIEWVGATMPCYEYQHFPGMDHLRFNVRNPQTAKQVSSVADQLGKPRALSELYGVSGQGFNFKGRKWIGDWHLALGINLLNPHLWLYTMRGERKRDFPPTISYQQPHWKKSAAMSNHNAALSQALSSGRRVVDVLLMHPVETGWLDFTPYDLRALEPLDRAFAEAMDALLGAQLDFHLGDETLMAKYGGVDGAKLGVGSGRYSVAVLPYCATLRRETVALLGRFARAGGTLIVLGDKPTLVDGTSRGAAALRRVMAGAVVTDLKGLARAVRRSSAPRVTVRGANARKVLVHMREVRGRHVLFLANTDYDRGADLTVTVAGVAQYAGLADLSTGEGDVAHMKATALPQERFAGGSRFRIDLAEVGSALVIFSDSPWPDVEPAMPRNGRSVRLAPEWRVKRMDENALALDYVRTPDSDRGWRAPQYVLFAAEEMKRAGGEARARYEFHVDALPHGPMHLAIERPERWRVAVNGEAVPSEPVGWWVDTEFKRLDITAHVRLGRNVIEVAGEVTPDFELESVYVLGRFGVYRRGAKHEGAKQVDSSYALRDLTALGKQFVIGAVPKTVTAADLAGQGFQFFAGTVELEQDVTLAKRPAAAWLDASALLAGAAEVRVNGQVEGDLLWPPYRIPLSGLRRGRNKVLITLFSTLRNLLGPHHWDEGDPEWVGPGSFSDRKHWTDEYRFHAFGIEGARIVVK